MDATITRVNLLVQQTLTAWHTQNNSFVELLNSLPVAQLEKEIAPGKNTGIYLAGHLIAVSDDMLLILGFSERLYPALDAVFIESPDKRGLARPALAELREMLTAVNAKLSTHFQSTTVDEWLSRHNAVSPEDFANQPYRNKLNVVINRTNHMAHHLGQLVLLK